jgi:serine protease Do
VFGARGAEMTTPVERIIIRHLSGSKANQIEQLPVGDAREFTIGRDPASKIAFDPVGDSVVSRKHAIIRMTGEGDNVSFKLSDAGSSNGTFLNGERVTGEVELLPEDTIELGAKGPKFAFDVQPRPTNFAARTKVIGVADTAATRVIKTAEVAASTAVSAAATGASTAGGPSADATKKSGVGQETVQRLIGEERGKAARTMTGVIAAVVAFFVLGGAALYWTQHREFERRDAEEKLTQNETDERLSRIPDDVNRKIGMKPREIYDKFAKSTVQIGMMWRLYDKQTGRPIQHKTVDYKGRRYPAYVQLPNNLGVVRWLTLEDDHITNLMVGGGGTGSGFVISEQGYILTNKHVAAGWQVAYGDEGGREGILYDYVVVSSGKKRKAKIKEPKIIDLRDSTYSDVFYWIPESGGYIFKTDDPTTALAGNTPDPNSNNKATFVGRNEVLEVKFHGSRLGVNASLVRTSPDADAALVKIDSPQTLTKVDLAPNAPVEVGENIIVLGYPAVSVENFVLRQTEERGRIRSQLEKITEATVTEGIVSKTASGVKSTEGGTFASDMGDVYQLSVVATGSGNSGGPVFNSMGKVIGLFTYSRNVGDTKATMAVPIKYGAELTQAQRE